MRFSIFVIFSVFVLSIGRYKIFSERRFTSSKPLGWLSLVATFLATQIGSSSFIYTAQYAYWDGIFAILYPLGTSLGLLVLGLGIGAKIHKLQLTDVSEVFEKHYQSGILKKIACGLLVISLLGLLIAQAIALKELLKTIGIAQDSFFVAIWMAIVFCTVKGTAKNGAWTEFLQALIVLGVLSAVYFFSAQSSWKEMSFLQGLHRDSFEGVHGKLSSYLLLPCFLVFLEPETIQTIPWTWSKRKMLTATLFSGCILLIVSLIPTYCGIIGQPIEIRTESSAFMDMAIGPAHPMLITCCTCLLLIAFACSASSLLRSLTTKIKETCSWNKNQEGVYFNTSYPSCSWMWTLVLGIATLIASYSNARIPDIIFTSYELMVVCLLVPVIQAAFSYSSQEISKLGATLSMLFGGLSFCLCHTLAFTFFPVIFSLILSWIGFSLGKFISKKVLCQAKIKYILLPVESWKFGPSENGRCKERADTHVRDMSEAIDAADAVL